MVRPPKIGDKVDEHVEGALIPITRRITTIILADNGLYHVVLDGRYHRVIKWSFHRWRANVEQASPEHEQTR